MANNKTKQNVAWIGCIGFMLLGAILAFSYSVNALVYYPPIASVGAGDVTSTHILDGTLLNADINASAAIDFSKIAGFFQKICRHLIVEFIPKDDSQVKRMLATREDIFPDYTVSCFESVFQKYFTILAAETIKDSQRNIYLMQRKEV